MTRMASTEFRCCRICTLESFVLIQTHVWAEWIVRIEYCSCDSVTLQCHTAHRNFHISSTLGKGILHVLDRWSQPFHTWFPHKRCHVKGQGFGYKKYISKLFTYVVYMHMVSSKNQRGFFFVQVFIPFPFCNVWPSSAFVAPLLDDVPFFPAMVTKLQSTCNNMIIIQIYWHQLWILHLCEKVLLQSK